MNTSKFTFFYENIDMYQFNSDWVIFVIMLIAGILLMAVSYYAMQTFALYSISYHAEQVIKNKKKTLGDLILMKDIQTELESEIEQAILKAAFHS